MSKIGTVEQTTKIIDSNNFHIKKKFGQNFIIDQNVLNNIVSSSQIDSDTCVIEIGPGLGSLTEVMLKKAKKVMSFEIDNDLIPILSENLDGEKIYKIYIHCNTDFIFKGKTLFEARELRFLRRLVRDERERSCTYEKTINTWDAVCAGEDKNIRPFKNNANYHLKLDLKRVYLP